MRSIIPMPITIENVKSIYVSEKSTAWKRFLPAVCKVLRESSNGEEITEYRTLSDMVTVFVYSHKMFMKSPKDLRRTFFDGYSSAVEFYSPGYGELPSNEDFRRTLFWNPYVRTNKEGYVDLRICNTGTCRQLIISAEAITPDGNIVKSR